MMKPEQLGSELYPRRIEKSQSHFHIKNTEGHLNPKDLSVSKSFFLNGWKIYKKICKNRHIEATADGIVCTAIE